MSKSRRIPQDKDEPVQESHSEITQQTSRRTQSHADFARNAPSENDSQGVTGANIPPFSHRPLRSREPHRVNNPPTAVPAAIQMSQSRPMTITTRHKDISDGTSPESRSRGRQVSSS
jgi:hypothetical protein